VVAHVDQLQAGAMDIVDVIAQPGVMRNTSSVVCSTWTQPWRGRAKIAKSMPG
jgi:hypothetical protein